MSRSCLSGSREPQLSSHGAQAPSISDSSPKCTGQDQEKEETPGSEDHPTCVPSSSAATHSDREETVITSIRAADIALGLRQLLAGFYAVVRHSGLEWRTENKRSLLRDDVVEWSEPIPIPSDSSATVCLDVHASFESQPVSGSGVKLRELTTTVEQLLDRSEKDIPFTFSPSDGDIVSPCSSISVAIKRQKHGNSDSSVSRAVDPHSSTTDSRSEPEVATNQGHSALSRHRKYGGKQDLERSIEEFDRALSICLVDHPCRAVAQSNLAMAKFIHCQVEDTDTSLEDHLSLYQNALATRPVGHVDRPSTLIRLAAVHFLRFEKCGDEVEGARAETLLHEALELSSTDSHEKRAATSVLQLHARRKVGPAKAHGQSSVDQDSPSSSTDEDPVTLGVGLLERFGQYSDLADLQQAITVLEALISSTSVGDDRYRKGKMNLGVALSYRFDHLAELHDLECAISKLKDAVDLTSHEHPDKPACLSNLGSSLFSRFLRQGKLSDLEDAISRHREAVNITTQGHASRPDHLNNLGNSIAARFERLGDRRDLEDSISMLKDAVDLTPHDHSAKPSRLCNLGISLFNRFKHFGRLSDLEGAISRHRDAVDLTPHGHPLKPNRLNSLGNSIGARFQRLGELNDLEEAISRHRDAVELTSQGHPQKPGYLNNLGNSFRVRYRRLGELSDLEDAISCQRVAVDLTPRDHRDKPICLQSLGTSLLTRFDHLEHPGDLDGAISMLRDAVDLTPPRHSGKPHRLNDLGRAFRTRFDHLGDLSNLAEAILRLRDAVDLTPQGHRHKTNYLNNLGTSFFTRFQRHGELSDLEDAISVLRDAVDLTHHGHPDNPSIYNNLGNSYKARFDRIGELRDLEDAILRYRNALDLTPHNHPDKPGRLNNLGNALRARFKCPLQFTDLEDAISSQRYAIDIIPRGHSQLPTFLSSLGSSLKARFEHLGELSDLEDAISRHRDADDLTPHGHPDKPSHLNKLGTCFLVRFEHLRELSDLEDANSRHRNAVDLTPHGHPDMPSRLHNLSNSCFARFQRFADLNNLQDGISILRNAINLTPCGHPAKPRRLNTLGNSFLTRFEHLGELSDLEDAISSHRDAADLTPYDHPHRPGYLNNLGRSILARFNRLGDLSDLEDAISMSREAVDLTPQDHLDKPGRLNNLGHSFFTRFERLGELSDLEDAILRHRNAVDLVPHTHPDKPAHLNNLGNSFFTRFSRLGELSDLERAISMLTDAVALTPRGHPDMPGNLNNLGNSFTARFERLRELSDLEEAISILRHAVELAPHGHTHQPNLLNSLGSAFRIRFKCLGELSDMENAILRHGDAVGLTPRGHPDRSSHLNNLANSFIIRFERLGEPNDLEQAIFLYSQAASTPIGSIHIRFNASQKWISCALRILHHSLLHAYSVSLTLLPQLAWIGLSLTSRYSELTQGADLVREAAAAALDSGLPETAVEWLEQGRSIVWGELFQLRSSYDELSAAHPDHAHRLRDLSAALEHASSTREKSESLLSEQTQNGAQRPAESLQQVADRHRALAIKRDKLLREIRRLPGFEQFLLRKEFSQLRASAHTGPVVILNAAESRCDALIVLADVDHVIHVPLPKFPYQRSAGFQKMLEKLLGHDRVIPCEDRKGDPAIGSVSWESHLSVLWNDVVKAVLNGLAFSIPGDLSRIFWCPTGPFVFLPIHAAGYYDTRHSQPGHKVSDFVVSSYIPTLSILALSSNSRMVPRGDLCLLAVRQPTSDGLPPLPGVDTELEHIRALIKHSPSASTTLLESSVGTVEEVLSLMKEADWVHFACHGIQDAVDSGLCLADRRRLKLRDIIALSRPRGGLAFLSACQTAMGEERLSDEAIHIAAGMLFAGYAGVVGTMWSISDQLAPTVARDVYERLFRDGTRPDYRDAARALHEAIGRLRESGRVPFVKWLPFIHVGL